MCNLDLLLQQERLKDFLVAILVSHRNKKHISKLLCCSLYCFLFHDFSLLRARMTHCNVYYDVHWDIFSGETFVTNTVKRP